jgi:hypothetical protein
MRSNTRLQHELMAQPRRDANKGLQPLCFPQLNGI